MEALGESAPPPEPTPAVAREATPETAPASVPREGDGIAIVGMACRFPGAPDLRAFWNQLDAGRDAVTRGRRDNGSWAGIAGDPADADDAWNRGGFVDEIDRFDARFFGMTPIGTRMMDPQQRLLLETSWRALEDAGIDLESLRGSSTGVYAGIATSEYRDLMMMAGGEGLNYLGTASSMALGGVAFKLGLTGPTMPVVLNCAASLVAVHHAAAALKQGEVDLALVGGVNAIFSPGLTREMVELGMLSPDGRCKTFDASADGAVRSEGCGMVVLKRLRDAEADGDRIWGVVRGTAVNQNGTTAGPTVPNGRAQQRVIRDALARARVAPGQVDYLEAHGGGSSLGDPIEVQAAAAVYGDGREADRPLLIGSVKTNIGHLESAAGIAGLIKIILSMRQGVIPKHLHFTKPNEHVDWDALPVRVTSEQMRWPRDPDRPPLAGVSAFGISGTNAHVVVEGYGPSDGAASANGDAGRPAGAARLVGIAMPEPLTELPPPSGDFDPRTARVLPLSGKSGTALGESAERYLAWLDAHARDLDAAGGAADALLADMAWTAGVGRDHFPHRAGVAFRDVASLREGLRTVATAGPTMPSPRGGAAPLKLAVVYAGEDAEWTETGKVLYRTEPVARAVLDRCDEILRDERGGASLVDAMFGPTGAETDIQDPAWNRPAIFALECAATALWSSVGVRPGVVAGRGVGALAAAWTAGVFGLEDGLRIASRRGIDGMREAASGITLSPPALSIVSPVTGRVVGPEMFRDGAYWRDAAHSLDAPRHRTQGLADLDVDLILEIGPVPGPGPAPLDGWPDGSDQAASDPVAGTFAARVARAYAAGLPVSFAGLFAGESRRRISVPGYPFQRERYWF